MTKKMVFVFGVGYFVLFFFFFLIDELTLNDMILILGVDINASM
jgi:hypothetical protein